MLVQSLQLTDYRSYPSLDLLPSSGLNILVGSNGQGKSNILEAIYLLATTRSTRAHRDQELVRFRADLARVVARVERRARPDVTIEVDIANGHKVGKVNGVRHARLVDLLGEFNAVQFAPADVDLVIGGPASRRSFLNLQIAQTSGAYAYTLIYYKRVLEQRNRLLKDAARAGGMSPANRQTLETLTEQLIGYGGAILEKREQFVTSLARFADPIQRELAGAEATLDIIYRPGWHDPDPAVPANAESFRAALEEARPQELRRGMTVAGPHRDDLQLLVAGLDVRVYGSRGEQRTAALSLKLAEFLLLQEIAGESPVLLLDDVLSELDDERSLRVISGSVGPCQTFLTGASLRSFPAELVESARLYHVRRGAVSARNAVSERDAVS